MKTIRPIDRLIDKESTKNVRRGTDARPLCHPQSTASSRNANAAACVGVEKAEPELPPEKQSHKQTSSLEARRVRK